MSAEQRLLERQARVYEVLDVATKPAKLFVDGMKFWLFVLVLLLMAIGYPVYEVVNGQTVATTDITRAVLCLAGLVLFLLSPYYVVLGGTAAIIWFGYWVYHHTEAELAAVPAQLWAAYFLGLGYAQYLLQRLVRKKLRQQRNPRRAVARQMISQPRPNFDAPARDDLLQNLNEMLQSVSDELETGIERDLDDREAPNAEFNQRMSELGAMPTDEALKATSAMLVEQAARFKELHQQMTSEDFANRVEAKANVRELLLLQEQVDCTLSTLIVRLKQEAAPYPVRDFEQVLAECRATTAAIKRTAAAKGLL